METLLTLTTIALILGFAWAFKIVVDFLGRKFPALGVRVVGYTPDWERAALGAREGELEMLRFTAWRPAGLMYVLPVMLATTPWMVKWLGLEEPALTDSSFATAVATEVLVWMPFICWLGAAIGLVVILPMIYMRHRARIQLSQMGESLLP